MPQSITDIVLIIGNLVETEHVLDAYKLVTEISTNGYTPQEKQYVNARFGGLLVYVYGLKTATQILEILYRSESETVRGERVNLLLRSGLTK